MGRSRAIVCDQLHRDVKPNRIRLRRTESAGEDRRKNKRSITSEKHLVWEGMAILEERDTSNTVIKRYFPEGQLEANNYYYTRDHLGSVREVSDATGALLNSYEYDAYGRQTAIYQSANGKSDFGYTGHYYHAASGLGLATYRGYNPDLGRWLSRDPIEEMGGMNVYGYVGNTPVDVTDLSGLAPDIDYHSPLDPADRAARNIPDDATRITIFGHATNTIIDDQRTYRPTPWVPPNTRIAPLTADDLVKAIKSLPELNTAKDIVIYGCNAGRGRNSLAQKLADRTGKTVWAPNDFFWTNDVGVTGVFRSAPDGTRLVDQPGTMIRFTPR
jgi:RHS repeat-associated protein